MNLNRWDIFRKRNSIKVLSLAEQWKRYMDEYYGVIVEKSSTITIAAASSTAAGGGRRGYVQPTVVDESPVLLPPTNVTSTSFDVNWEYMENAYYYKLEVSTTDTFDSPVIFDFLYGNTFTVNSNLPVLPDTTYFIRLTAIVATEWSNTATITLDSLTPQITIPIYVNDSAEPFNSYMDFNTTIMYSVDWGDGTIETNSSSWANLSHYYGDIGTYQIVVSFGDPSYVEYMDIQSMNGFDFPDIRSFVNLTYMSVYNSNLSEVTSIIPLISSSPNPTTTVDFYSNALNGDAIAAGLDLLDSLGYENATFYFNDQNPQDGSLYLPYFTSHNNLVNRGCVVDGIEFPQYDTTISVSTINLTGFGSGILSGFFEFTQNDIYVVVDWTNDGTQYETISLDEFNKANISHQYDMGELEMSGSCVVYFDSTTVVGVNFQDSGVIVNISGISIQDNTDLLSLDVSGNRISGEVIGQIIYNFALAGLTRGPLVMDFESQENQIANDPSLVKYIDNNGYFYKAELEMDGSGTTVLVTEPPQELVISHTGTYFDLSSFDTTDQNYILFNFVEALPYSFKEMQFSSSYVSVTRNFEEGSRDILIKADDLSKIKTFVMYGNGNWSIEQPDLSTYLLETLVISNLLFTPIDVNKLPNYDVIAGSITPTINLSNNSMTSSTIDDILVFFADTTESLSAGNLYITQTPEAFPTTLGLNAKVILEGRGWTVTTD